MNIESVKIKFEERLLQLPDVIGVGIGRKAEKTVIKIYVNRQTPQSSTYEQIPKSLDGYETDIEEIGDLTSLSRK